MVGNRLDIGERIEWNVHKFRKILIFMGAIGLTLLMLPTVWSDTRFEMDPGKVAAAEARMWKAYYSNNTSMLRRELLELLRSQFDLSIMEAMDVGKSLTLAAMKFDRARSNYKPKVLPDLELAYSRLKKATGTTYDPKEAAMAELDWWVARRTPGSDSVEDVGRLIAHLYSVLFGENQPTFERAGFLRAQAAHIRDEKGASCNWGMVEQLLHKSYLALQEGLELTSNNYSGQVTFNWDPNKENNIAGYKIYYGNSSRNYNANVDVGNRTSYTIKDLESGKAYYFVITAYNTSGIESSYSAEVSHKATVAITSPSLPQNPAEEYTLQEAEEGELRRIRISHQNSEIVWLPQVINLTKDTMGPLTVKVRVEGIDEQRYPSIFPRIRYYIGTESSYGYFDMINERDNVWRFDIPDPKWHRYSSKSLHYHVKVFDEEGNVITKSRWEKELIDSFIQQD